MRAFPALVRAMPPHWALVFVVSAAPAAVGAQGAPTPYRTHAGLSAELRALAAAHSARTTLLTVATSPGGRLVQALRVGAGGSVASRPALLVMANAHGPHVVGSEIALVTARRLLEGYGRDTAITRLLDRAAIWFIPRLNPDAAEAMFGSPRWERTANGTPWDDDRDGHVDEDGPNDLNGDGMITSLRLADPNGEWIADSAESVLLHRADGAKGEVGRWRLVSEGIDDDGDEEWNEDGVGGTDVNRNFAHGYAHHGAEAGLFPFSSPEARGLAEFMVAHPEVAAVYVLGPQDNTIRPWEFRAATGIAGAVAGTSAGGPLTSIMRADEPTFADVSRRFQRTTGLTRGPAAGSGAGDLLSHFYYVFGRWSFGSRGWWAPDAARDTTVRAGATGGGAARVGGATDATRAGADSIADQRAALRWFRAQQIDAFVPWTAVALASEPGAEVGGFRPGALLNPPEGEQLDSTLARQQRFIVELAGMLPKVGLRDIKVESLGEGVWRVSVEVGNDGVLASTTALSARLRMPRGARLELEPKGTTILNGERIQVVGQLAGGGRSTRRAWTVAGVRGATMTLTVESPVAGTSSQTITLR